MAARLKRAKENPVTAGRSRMLLKRQWQVMASTTRRGGRSG